MGFQLLKLAFTLYCAYLERAFFSEATHGLRKHLSLQLNGSPSQAYIGKEVSPVMLQIP